MIAAGVVVMSDTDKKRNEKKRILIVDDDKLTGTMLREILSTEGYNAKYVTSGEAALEEVEAWHPELILLDLVMPGMSGGEVCSAIREAQLPIRPSIVIVSSRGDKSVIADALSRGADDFIVKPVDELELLARIKAHLRISGFYAEVEEDKTNLETILEITNALGETLDSSEILGQIVNRVAEITHAVRCSIVLVGKDDEGYVLVSHDNSDVRNLRIDLSRYPEILEVLSIKESLAVEDMTNHPLMSSVKQHIKGLDGMSVLVVPIVFNEDVLGTLFLRSRRAEEGFTKKEISLCQILANASYHAIKNAKLYEEINREKERLREMAITDQLTELFNHNYFYKRLEEEFERSVRYETDLSIIMMDIDNFKKINDLYGHRSGDKVLKEVAMMIKRSVRKIDFVARYGGEEFSVIMPHTPLKGALLEAERLRKLIEEHSYAGLLKENITVSMGVAAYPTMGIMNAGDLVNMADNALYEAKVAGKNCVKSKETA